MSLSRVVERALVAASVTALLSSVSACGSRTALQQPHDVGRPRVDAAIVWRDAALPKPDIARPDPDAGGTCPARAAWGFVTNVPYTKPTNLDREFTGVLAYWGKIRVPLASAPFFDREVELVDDYSGQSLLVLQYYLPAGVELPLVASKVYTFVLRRRLMFEGHAQALAIRRPTSGLWPLLFVGEPAAYGQALDFDDALMAPLTITQLADPYCVPTRDICGTGAHLDRLRFRATTGAGISEALLAQGERGAVSMMGVDYTVMNVESYRIEQPCADEPPTHASWLATAQKY